jgi:hypothetical protein
MRCQNALDKQACLQWRWQIPPFADITTMRIKTSWQNFRNLYSAARDNQVNDYIVSQRPLADDDALVNQGFQLRFGTNKQTATQSGATWFPPVSGAQPPGIPTTGLPASTVTQTYTGRCQSYIDQWKQSLLQCSALASKDHALRDWVLNGITVGMVAVCIKE